MWMYIKFDKSWILLKHHIFRSKVFVTSFTFNFAPTEIFSMTSFSMVVTKNKGWYKKNNIVYRIKKKLCRAQVESEGSDEYFRPKYITGNREMEIREIHQYHTITKFWKAWLKNIPHGYKCRTECECNLNFVAFSYASWKWYLLVRLKGRQRC